jgi:hypothetical protein
MGAGTTPARFHGLNLSAIHCDLVDAGLSVSLLFSDAANL